MAQKYKASYFEEDRENQDRCSSVSFDRDTNSLSLRHQSLLSDLFGQSDAGDIPLQPHLLVTKPPLPSRQTVKRHCVHAIDFQTYRPDNHSTHNYSTVSHFRTKILKKIESKVKAHFFDPSNPISIIGFVATLKLVCDTNRIHEGATMLILLLFVKKSCRQL